jgi:hypothetical protein
MDRREPYGRLDPSLARLTPYQLAMYLDLSHDVEAALTFGQLSLEHVIEVLELVLDRLREAQRS